MGVYLKLILAPISGPLSCERKFFVSGKFSLSSKKKEKNHPNINPELLTKGGLSWDVEVCPGTGKIMSQGVI